MTEETNEREVSEIFLKTVDTFYKESSTIFEEFDAIRENYLKGENIMDELHEFRLKRASIFTLIDGIFHKEVDLADKLDKAEIGKEKRAKIQEFKTRFADIADEINLYVIRELGVGSR
ncbi:MAG: hypothetical protein IBX41_07330 [Methanophagales archaeon]|nr:hypothetical protein [Methanophagales archaeon]